MFKWLRRGDGSQKFPEYSALRKTPTRRLPRDLAEQEKSEAFRTRRDEIEASLRELSNRPQPENPLFVEIVSGDQRSLVTILGPGDESRCLPVFSTPLRAADYVRTQLDPSSPVSYLSSSPLELIALLRDLRGVGVEKFTVDRCPRCNVFCAIHSASVTAVDDAINCWSIPKSGEFARMELYLSYAQGSARAGKLYDARDVLLETAGHVSFEDPRVHVLLGQVAVALYDGELLREAKAFLQFLQFDSWERRLDWIVQSGSREFEI